MQRLAHKPVELHPPSDAAPPRSKLHGDCYELRRQAAYAPFRAAAIARAGADLRRGDLLGRLFQPASLSRGVIELLREPHRIDRIAGRTDIQTGPKPRPRRLGCGQPRLLAAPT